MEGVRTDLLLRNIVGTSKEWKQRKSAPSSGRQKRGHGVDNVGSREDNRCGVHGSEINLMEIFKGSLGIVDMGHCVRGV